MQSRPLSVVFLWALISISSVVRVSFSSLVIFLVVSSVEVLLQGQVVLQILLRMPLKAQGALEGLLWSLVPSVLAFGTGANPIPLTSQTSSSRLMSLSFISQRAKSHNLPA